MKKNMLQTGVFQRDSVRVTVRTVTRLMKFVSIALVCLFLGQPANCQYSEKYRSYFGVFVGGVVGKTNIESVNWQPGKGGSMGIVSSFVNMDINLLVFHGNVSDNSSDFYGKDIEMVNMKMNTDIYLIPKWPAKPYILVGWGLYSFDIRDDFSDFGGGIWDIGLGFDLNIARVLSIYGEGYYQVFTNVKEPSWGLNDNKLGMQAGLRLILPLKLKR